MTRISIIAAENSKKKRHALRLKCTMRNKHKKITAYRLQKQREAINILLQSLNRTGSRKEPELPVSVKEDKSLFNRLRGSLHWLFTSFCQNVLQ